MRRRVKVGSVRSTPAVDKVNRQNAAGNYEEAVRKMEERLIGTETSVEYDKVPIDFTRGNF